MKPRALLGAGYSGYRVIFEHAPQPDTSVRGLFSSVPAKLLTVEALSTQFMECKFIGYGYSQALECY
jgi:hypothetical protein